jgi:hypothetical protein
MKVRDRLAHRCRSKLPQWPTGISARKFNLAVQTRRVVNLTIKEGGLEKRCTKSRMARVLHLLLGNVEGRRDPATNVTEAIFIGCVNTCTKREPASS